MLSRCFLFTVAALLFACPNSYGQNKTSNAFVPEGAIAVIVGHPGQLFKEPALQILPFEIASAAGLEYAGFDPADIRQVRYFFGIPTEPNTMPINGGVIELTNPVDAATVLKKLEAPVKEGTTPGGAACLLFEEGPPLAVVQVTSKQVLVGAPETVDAMLAAKDGGTNELAGLVSRLDDTWHSYAIAIVEPMREILNGMIEREIENAPSEIHNVSKLPDLSRAALLRFDMSNPSKADIVLQTVSEEAAIEAEKIFGEVLAYGKQQMLDSLDEADVPVQGPTGDAMKAYARRMADFGIGVLTPKRSGTRLSLHYQNDPVVMNKLSAAWFWGSVLLPIIGMESDQEIEQEIARELEPEALN